MGMRAWIWLWGLGAALTVALIVAPMRTLGQEKMSGARAQHVVSLDELSKDAAQPARTRQQNEEEIRQLLRSEAGQQALKTAKVDYQRVDKAIGQLSNEDLASVAERSRQVDRDFAGGAFGTTLVIAIVLIVVLIIVLTVVFG